MKEARIFKLKESHFDFEILQFQLKIYNIFVVFKEVEFDPFGSVWSIVLILQPLNLVDLANLLI